MDVYREERERQEGEKKRGRKEAAAHTFFF
jgi:hypothetical protein